MKSILDLIIKKRKNKIKATKKNIIKINSNGNQREKIALRIVNPHNRLPGNPIVLYGHSEDETIDDTLNTAFIDDKISYCTMDYRGYGYSDGDYQTSGFTELEDMITVINYLKSNGYEKISYFGKSIGATIGISIAAKFPDLVCVALDTPILSLREYFKHQAQLIYHISEKTFDLAFPRVLSKIKNDFGIDYKTWIEPKELLPLITQPIYALFYTDDDFIYAGNQEFYEKIKSKKGIISHSHIRTMMINEYIKIYDFIVNLNKK